MTDALVVIDVQKIMWADPKYRPHEGDAMVDRIADLIARARAAGKPVFWVQHVGGEHMQPGKPLFAFHDKVAPGAGDDVTVKNKSSAFHGTDFDDKLKRAGVDHLIVTGMQSEYCVNSAVRGAYERGYKITLVSDAHSTFDSKNAKGETLIAIQNEVTKDSFGAVKPAAEVTF